MEDDHREEHEALAKAEQRLKLIQHEVEQLRKDQDKKGLTITLLQGWLQVYHEAYDALLTWGVDFKKLREYLKYPEEVDHKNVNQHSGKLIEWFGRVTSGIRAAIRRKQLHVHDNPDFE